MITEAEKEAIKCVFTKQDNKILEELSQYEMNNIQDCCKNTFENFCDNFIIIAENSRNHYYAWRQTIQNRVTGDNIYKIYTYTKNKKADWTKLSKQIFSDNNYKAEILEFSVRQDGEACKLFATTLTRKSSINVFNVGTIVSVSNPWLCFTPDGVVFENNVPVALLVVNSSPATRSCDNVVDVLTEGLKKGNGQYFIALGAEGLSKKKNTKKEKDVVTVQTNEQKIVNISL